MSNVPANSLETLHLLPREISIDPAYHVRPFSLTHTDAEDKLIEQLANAMETVGQLDNILITPKRELICGHRRRKAAIVINERRSVRGESLFHLRCTVDQAGGDLWRKAIMSNLHRKESSVMDFAYLITQIRNKFNWRGNDGYTKVAEYLGVERTIVYQAERFLSAPGYIQTMLHAGELSIQSALKILRKVPEREQAKAVELAEQYQEEDRLDKVLATCEKAHKSPEAAAVMIRQQPERKRIEAPAVNRAIRTVSAARVPLTRAELIDGLTRLEQPDLSPSHHNFLSYLLHTYILGQGTLRELRARFSMIGTPLAVTNGASTYTHSPPN